jgi:hypothetical protein
MAKTVFDKLVGAGFTPYEADLICKGLVRIGGGNKSLTEQFDIFINGMCHFALIEHTSIKEADILEVASKIGKASLSEMQIDEVILRYPFFQKEDPSGTWNLVVEQLLYEVTDEKYHFEYAISTEEIKQMAKSKKSINKNIH